MNHTTETKNSNVDTKQNPEFKAVARKLGLRLRQCREAKGLTLEQAGERVGMNWRVIQRVEAGQSNVTLGTLYRISSRLEIDLSDLFRQAP